MSFYDQVADLPLAIEKYDIETIEREQLSGRTRTSTVISLQGEGTTGRGEDVTYNADDHEALMTAQVEADGRLFSFDGNYTFTDFSAMLDDVSLFPNKQANDEAFSHYRRWAVESAALDLALKQAGTNLAEALSRVYDPVRFVLSSQLRGSEPLKADRVKKWVATHPNVEFKCDVTSGWTANLIEELVGTDAVRILDLKGQYKGTPVDQPADRDLYKRVVEAFPEAIIEDPAVTNETLPVLESVSDRLSWDAPITDVESIEALPSEPQWLNIKPSRFGTVESLFETVEYCLTNGIELYGGGQSEGSIGREHIHALASVFYPTTPNDVAPRGYNGATIDPNLPVSPLHPPSDTDGLEWSTSQ